MSTARRAALGGAALLAGLLGWYALIVLPALPAFRGGALELFAALALGPICHRLPERSLWLMGAPLGVCARCSAIYFGFGLGVLCAWRAGAGRAARGWLIGVVPTAVDGALALLGVWDSPLGLRLVSGALAGASLARLLWPVYLELWTGARSRGPAWLLD